MVDVAVYAADPATRQRLARLAADRTELNVVGIADGINSLRHLVDRTHTDIVLADAMPQDLARHAAFVLIVDDPPEDAMLDALYAGAAAVLPNSATDAEIALAVTAVAHGSALLPRPLLEALLAAERPDRLLTEEEDPDILLTPREVEVLAAMADGVSNKVIARRLGISFHTVKFHVAAILAKLDAESRTEAVAQAARLGLVML
jgi:DNA-binding NarL/FixJ family response regulator